jgi:hypothetical protein
MIDCLFETYECGVHIFDTISNAICFTISKIVAILDHFLSLKMSCSSIFEHSAFHFADENSLQKFPSEKYAALAFSVTCTLTTTFSNIYLKNWMLSRLIDC